MKRYIHGACSCDDPSHDFSNGSFYSLFVGLHDGCGEPQVMSLRQARTFAEKVCAHYFVNGYTILEGMGADRGTPDKLEPSIYIMAINAPENDVFWAADILQREFRQSEILIERNQTRYLYFNNR